MAEVVKGNAGVTAREAAMAYVKMIVRTGVLVHALEAVKEIVVI